jgi:VWFA-related protein
MGGTKVSALQLGAPWCGRSVAFAQRAAALLIFLCGPLLAQTAGSAAAPAAGGKIPASPPVLIDAVVTDHADAPIHGLTAADFHIFEDGKEQVITGFQTHTGPATPGVSQQQRIVLLFGSQSPDAQQWIQQAAAKFVAENAGPNRLMEIIFTDICYKTSATPYIADARQLQHVLDTWPDLLHCEHPADPGGDLRAVYYAQVAQSLARMPGHKVVALFVATAGPSAGAAENRPPEAAPSPSTRGARGRREPKAEPHQDPFDMEREFRKADASVYPVQAQAGGDLPKWAVSLATATGGHGLTRGNDGPGALDPLTRELDESYTLAFSPRASPEGSCHQLKVTVNRPDAKVLARNLYCNVVEQSAAPLAKPRESELDSLAASADAGNTAASASVPFFYQPNGMARVHLALEIPAPVLEPVDRNGKLHAEMDVLGVAYVPSGDVAARFTHKMKFDFDTRRQFEEFLRRPLHCEHQFEVAPGNYVFKVVFRSAKNRFGAVETPLAIEPFHAAQLSLSAIALSRNVQPISSEAAQDEAETGQVPLIFRGNRFTVSGSDVLPRTGTAEAYFEIYQPLVAGTGAVQLTMRMRLLDAQGNQERWNSGDVDLSPLAKLGNRVIPVALILPVAGLPAGTYRAELTVKDSAGGKAARTINFRTE